MFSHSLEHLKNIRYRNINCTPDFFVNLCGFTYMYIHIILCIILKDPSTKSDIKFRKSTKSCHTFYMIYHILAE